MLIDNKQDRYPDDGLQIITVWDFLQEYSGNESGEKGQLDIVTGFFTIYTLSKLYEDMPAENRYRIISSEMVGDDYRKDLIVNLLSDDMDIRNIGNLEDFKQPKIIYREIGIEMDAVLAPADWFINNKLYMITGTNLEILLAFLNCCAFNRIILKSANITGGKGVDYMEKIRVPSDIIVDSYEQYDDCLYQYCNLSESEINFLKAIDY